MKYVVIFRTTLDYGRHEDYDDDYDYVTDENTGVNSHGKPELHIFYHKYAINIVIVLPIKCQFFFVLVLIDKCEDKEDWCNHGVKCVYKGVQSHCPKLCGLCKDSNTISSSYPAASKFIGRPSFSRPSLGNQFI